ncbi:MAG: peptidase M14 family protein, partial [Chlorobiales bacterium]|nr:peptidase M14 family protein [Chlorobiales bacterium]
MKFIVIFIEYFYELGKSPCVKVEELGKSTEGNPFLLILISSPENLKNIEKIRYMSYRIAHPKGLKKEELEQIITEGRAVVSMIMSIHATEVGGTQMAPELAYELATKPEFDEIRKNT